MTVAELIAHLQTLPQDLQVCFRWHSDHVLMDVEDIHMKKACYPRQDGWIQDERPDMPSQMYVMFP